MQNVSLPASDTDTFKGALFRPSRTGFGAKLYDMFKFWLHTWAKSVEEHSAVQRASSVTTVLQRSGHAGMPAIGRKAVVSARPKRSIGASPVVPCTR
jgi:hypothetical protein